jgi:hypothetical protein
MPDQDHQDEQSVNDPDYAEQMKQLEIDRLLALAGQVYSTIASNMQTHTKLGAALYPAIEEATVVSVHVARRIIAHVMNEDSVPVRGLSVVPTEAPAAEIPAPPLVATRGGTATPAARVGHFAHPNNPVQFPKIQISKGAAKPIIPQQPGPQGRTA